MIWLRKVLQCVAILSMCLAGSLAWADFSLYWRDNNTFFAEYRAFNTLDLDKTANADGVGNNRQFSTLKLRMKPSLNITDRLSFHMAFDVFVNPFTTHAQEGGAIQGQQAADTTNFGPSVDPNLSRASFGSVSGFGTSALTPAAGNNILVKEGFLEYIGDWGIFRLGRMPRHWGLGMRYHKGDSPADKFSDRTDSLFYEFSLANFKLAAICSKILENTLDSGGDDFTLWEGYLHWNDPEKDLNAGLLYSFLKSSQNFVAMNTFDGYATKKFKRFRMGLEGLFTSGDPGTVSGNDANQKGLAVEAHYDLFDWFKNLSVYGRAGFASGADLDKPTTLSIFTFNRNYDIAMILFNQGVGAIPNQTGVSASSNPDANAITNTYYFNAGADYSFNDRVGVNFNYAVAQAPLPVTRGGNKFYGHEVDLNGWYRFRENLNLGGSVGLFLPGEFYNGSPQRLPAWAIDHAYGAQMGVTLLF